ncbi:MAG TPA: lipid-A-disaccharide synthase [Deltaproteobacteria bacterium]|nr:MAG: lipid-A-disaccharide synthase [Deltaproteobacteria bacterium GWA2_55_82]OGQ64270.1 MAG: lipid-A-disaccharide synthase [Deltaproteobacteria bacterium RIFCSPLOWO2_02_FULL_55_12]OIJ73987.1 MAG: lipid-A-disaccharide synthase [Deltaproteobacteria bacterium GWC2_55_46]HBG46588.1 lipid-A-disaccharide synthase [Deltaproteobacteria bacterium]HCY09990.1 lipid-A-disaccharide synthase [Deltaproteobacteria bacterium]
MDKSIFIVSGEESGDLHGAALIRSLKKLIPGLNVTGMGGWRMKEEGMVGLDSRDVSVVGVVEVAARLPKIISSMRTLKRQLAGEHFDAVVLIDFPDFNLRIAKEARRLGVPVIYYISPQVWAWRKGRLGKIARLVNKMLVVFPFEYYLYRQAGVDVEYVGHPLADSARCDSTKEEARASFGIGAEESVVALLPGSRTGEVKRLLGPMVQAAAMISKEKKTVFLLPAARSIDDGLLAGPLKGAKADIRVVRGKMYEALRASDASVVASGTATLETALIGTPMVIVYKMSPVSYGIARALVGLAYAGLPNIVAERKVVPELLQGEATPENIAREVISLFDGPRREAMIEGYMEIKKNLGRGGAADKAARSIYNLITNLDYHDYHVSPDLVRRT